MKKFLLCLVFLILMCTQGMCQEIRDVNIPENWNLPIYLPPNLIAKRGDLQNRLPKEWHSFPPPVPGSALNSVHVIFTQFKTGNQEVGSADISMQILDNWLNSCPKPPDILDRYWVYRNYNEHHAFFPNSFDYFNRIFYRESQFNGLLQFVAQTGDTLTVPSPDGGGILLDGYSLIIPYDLKILKFDYQTDLDTLDMRERYYLELTGHDTTAGRVVNAVPISMYLYDGTQPLAVDSVWVYAVAFIDSPKTYRSEFLRVLRPMDIGDSLVIIPAWDEATDSTAGDIRDMKAKYYSVSDSAKVYHNLVRIEGPDTLERGETGEYTVAMYPGKIGYEMALYHWVFYPEWENLEDDTVTFEYVGLLRKPPSVLSDASFWEGKMVLPGDVHAVLYFENYPGQVITDTVYIGNDSVQVFDDSPIYINGFKSNDTLSVTITPRDWAFDEDDDVNISCFYEPFQNLPDSLIKKPPKSGINYAYENMVDLRLLNGINDTSGVLTLSDLDIEMVTEGPNEKFCYNSKKPYIYNLQRYVYPDFAPGEQFTDDKVCPEFVVRQGDNSFLADISFADLRTELRYGLGYNNDNPNSYLEIACDTLSLMHDTLDVNVVAESLIVIKDDKIKFSTFKNMFGDTLIKLTSPLMSELADKVHGISHSDIRTMSTNSPQWDALGFDNETYFAMSPQAEGHYIQSDGYTIGSKSEPINLKFLPDSARLWTSDTLQAEFKLRTSDGLDSLESGEIGWDVSFCDYAEYFWRFDSLYKIFDESVVGYIEDGALLTAKVTIDDIPVGADTVEVVPRPQGMAVYFANKDHDPVPPQSLFWARWDSVWVVVDSLPDSPPEPDVSCTMTGVATPYEVDNLEYNATTSMWEGTIDVSSLIPDEMVIDPGDYLEVTASYAGLDDQISRLTVFDLNAYAAPWGIWEGIIANNFFQGSSKTTYTFSANRHNFYKYNADNLWKDNLILKVESINVGFNDAKSLFASPLIVDSLFETTGTYHGTTNWSNIDSLNNYPFSSILDINETVAFMSQEWEIDVPSSTVTGRSIPLTETISVQYDDWGEDFGFGYDIEIELENLLKQDPINILRQEYYDFYDVIPSGWGKLKYILEGINVPLYWYLTVGVQPPGMYFGGTHHHSSSRNYTQNIPAADSIRAIWWNNGMIDDVMRRLDILLINHNNEYSNFPPASFKWESGYRCPVRNKNTPSPGANNSPHLEGNAVDFKLDWEGQNFRDDEEQRRRASKFFYEAWLLFRWYSNPSDSTKVAGGYVYGVANNATDAQGHGSWSMKPDGFVDSKGRSIGTVPDPRDTNQWPIRYVKRGVTYEVFYCRGHSDNSKSRNQ